MNDKTFLSMRGKIEVLDSLVAGKDIVRSERAYDVALVCDFKSKKIWKFTPNTRCICL